MARGNRRAKRGGFLSGLFGLINPIRDPSLLIAVILTVIWQGSTPQEWWRWALFGLLNWIAVKGVIWLLVNFAFSFVYLVRKGFWVMRNPRLAWRLLDALGTEEIIIGGLRPDMFADRGWPTASRPAWRCDGCSLCVARLCAADQRRAVSL